MNTSKPRKKRVTILTLFGVRDVGEHEMIQSLLERGFDINTSDSGGRTMLMEAVIRKDQWLIEKLLSKGADVNVRDHRNWTALHFAAQNYDIVSTRLLLENGGEVNAQDSYGNNVLWRAVFESRGSVDLLQLLIKYGADPTAKNNSGISASDVAKTISVNTDQLFKW